MKDICVITGGAGGMGLAAAKILGQQHSLLICDLDEGRLTEAARELQALGMSCETQACDICDEEAVKALFEKAQAKGRIAAVIHTAGISPQMASAEKIMRVNALGTIHITEACLAFADEGFVLVNVASMAAHMLPSLMLPTRSFAYAMSDRERFLKGALRPCKLMPKDFYRRGMSYSISKNFVMWYCKKMAGRFGERGARIVSVSPGSFDTSMGRLEEESGSAETLKQAALKRFGRPEEIAEVLAFCASDKASYLTGVDILCDGGAVAGRSK